jgi:hypothetical protein
MNKSIEILYCERECITRGFCRIAGSIQHQSTRGGNKGRELGPLEPNNLRRYITQELDVTQTTCLQPGRVVESVENVYSKTSMPKDVEEKLKLLKQQIKTAVKKDNLLSG